MDNAAEPIEVLAADPGLGGRLRPAELSAARRSVLAHVQRLPAGAWDIGQAEPPAVGFLVLEGCLTREVEILGQRAAIEFLAQGDVLRPAPAELGSVDSSVVWRALEPTLLAVLDVHFVQAAAPWPDIFVELVSRQERRAEWLTTILAISHLPRVDLRVLVLFWHFADRWGRVRGGEVTVPIPLTHLNIATLIGARRPTVTTALHRLGEAGLVVQQGKGWWALRGGPPTQMHDFLQDGGAVGTPDRASGT